MDRDEKIIYENERGQNIEFSVWSPFFLDNVDGLSGLSNTIYTSKGKGQDGTSYVDDSLEPRNIIISGVIAKDRRKNREKLLTIMNPKLSGRLTYKNDRIKRYIDCRIENAPTINKDGMPKFLISLFCPDPFFRNINDEKIDLVTWIPNLEFPVDEGFYTEQDYNHWLETKANSEGFEDFETGFGIGYGVEFGYREIKQIVEVENTGDVDSPMTIVFRADGDVVNPMIQNIETYEKLKINKTLKNGDVLTITTGYGNKNIYLNGEKAHHYLDFLNSTWLQLKPGINLIKYDAEKGLNNLECKIYHTPLYLGV